MTNVGAAELARRVDSLVRGTARKDPTDVERTAVLFQQERTYQLIAGLLVEINKQAGVRVFRRELLRCCLRALHICANQDGISFYEAAVDMREQNRHQGRLIPKRAVGSTLLLKGLEAEVAVILGADALDSNNLYVAMTRGSKRLVVCSRNPVLLPR